ncbi:AP-1 complex subunit gamma [[Candida] zeylanoides]
MGSLKSFIKAVRKAKTIADERAVVRKESAAIRTAFRDPQLDQTSRRTAIAKLLYLYIMGEKTHFGQVECLKLLVSPRFADKRLGYLATSLLLDENQEVLTLLTNSLDNDMQHPNAFVVALALCCLGNLASPELARDLHPNVDRILASTSNVYLRKKACLVAAKLVQKDPDHIIAEVFLPRARALAADGHHSTLLGVLQLIEVLWDAVDEEQQRAHLLPLFPQLVAHLRRVATSGYMPEYDVLGVADPFLQVSLIRTLRQMAAAPRFPQPHLDLLNDVLTEVTSRVEGSSVGASGAAPAAPAAATGKNVAHAILYECVRTIFAINSDQSLKILGVNLLGKFLQTKDNNIRYVALDSLLSVIAIEPMAVQRHRAIIVGCLGDGDVSIRRRALELTFAIVNEQNIRVLAREVLGFLETSHDADLKPYITSQLTIAAQKYSPNDKWHFDTLIRMLKVGGAHVTQDILSSILALVMQCNDGELRKHVVGRLLSIYLEQRQQGHEVAYGLAFVAVWCVGEYGELILHGNIEVSGKSQRVTEAMLVRFVEGAADRDDGDSAAAAAERHVALVNHVLTTALKLSVKLTEASAIESLRLVLSSRSYDLNLEVQIRAIEYQEIFAQPDKLKRGLLAKMPPPPLTEREALSLHPRKRAAAAGSAGASVAASAEPDLLLDLMDDATKAAAPAKRNVDILDLFDSPAQPQAPTAPVAAATAAATEVLSTDALTLSLAPVSFAAGHAVLEAAITSKAAAPLTHVQLLIAVPKSQKLSITSTTGGDQLAHQNASIRQVLDIVGKEGSKLKLRIKLKYVDGSPVEETVDYAFPRTL